MQNSSAAQCRHRSRSSPATSLDRLSLCWPISLLCFFENIDLHHAERSLDSSVDQVAPASVMSAPRMLAASARAARARPARIITIPHRPLSSSVAWRSNESHERPSDIKPTVGSGEGSGDHTHAVNKGHRLDVQSDAVGAARDERGDSHGAPGELIDSD